MYINYNLLLKLNIFKDFFYRKKIEQNCAYIKKNKKRVLKNLKNKEVLNVVFYVYDSCKWKCQKIYDEMLQNHRFRPLIVVTKNTAKNLDNPSFQTKEEILKTFDFFKKREMNVRLGFDFEKNKHVPLKKFKPDIIIYQHPWYVDTSQGPVVCSKFALTAYIPYDIPTTTMPSEYNLRFYQYVENFYVIDEKIKNFYTTLMDNNGVNLKVAGAPSLENIKPSEPDSYIIYAPHWTINHEKTMAYSTFKENGRFILEFAQKNSEYNWVFKPHPMLKKAILDNKFMSKKEVNEYYSSWEKIGKACYDGDYYEIFNNSKLMITDCSTFLIEYLATEKPLIRLASKDAVEFNNLAKEAIKVCYNIESNCDLEKSLNSILKEKQDTLKEKRIEYSKQLKKDTSKIIINDLLKQIEEG